MKKFIEEFKAFALKGNVLDMAVGVIIGGAFQNIITSFIDNIVNPIIGLAFQADFSSVGLDIGSVHIGLGAFISSVINFVLMALVLFIFVKAINEVRSVLEHKEEEEPAETVKSDELKALEEIRDLLKEQNSK